MSEKKEAKLKKHETFSIRDGWLEKAINLLEDNPNLFAKDNGQQILGIGTNMVKSLRYWTDACGLIKFKQGTGYSYRELGEFLKKNDPYLNDKNSWWLIHMFLVSNDDEAPVFNCFFNMNLNKFDKEQLFTQIKSKLEEEYTLGADSSLEADCNMLIKTYFSDDISNPEDNMTCPFSKLGLLSTNDKKIYTKSQPKYMDIDYKIIFYCMLKSIERKEEDEKKKGNVYKLDSFNLEDLFSWKNNPLRIFNISKSSMFQYLDEMKKNGLISLIKTAGLNTITINERKTLKDLF